MILIIAFSKDLTVLHLPLDMLCKATEENSHGMQNGNVEKRNVRSINPFGK